MRRAFGADMASGAKNMIFVTLMPTNAGEFEPRHCVVSEKKPLKIGRAVSFTVKPMENNGIFNSKVLSRSHAELLNKGGQLYLRDVGSSNGSFVDGEIVMKDTIAELKHGSLLKFGIDVVDGASVCKCVSVTIDMPPPPPPPSYGSEVEGSEDSKNVQMSKSSNAVASSTPEVSGGNDSVGVDEAIETHFDVNELASRLRSALVAGAATEQKLLLLQDIVTELESKADVVQRANDLATRKGGVMANAGTNTPTHEAAEFSNADVNGRVLTELREQIEHLQKSLAASIHSETIDDEFLKVAHAKASEKAKPLESLTVELETTKSLWERVQHDVAAQKSIMENELSQVNEELAASRLQLSKTSGASESNESLKQQLQTAERNYSNDLSKLNSEIVQLRKDVKEAESARIDAVSSTPINNSDESRDVEGRILKLTSIVRELQEENSRLKSEVGSTSEAESINVLQEKLKKSCARADNAEDEVKSVLGRLQASLTELEFYKVNTSGNNGNDEKRSIKLKEELKSVQDRLEHVSNNLELAEKKIASGKIQLYAIVAITVVAVAVAFAWR